VILGHTLLRMVEVVGIEPTSERPSSRESHVRLQ